MLDFSAKSGISLLKSFSEKRTLSILLFLSILQGVPKNVLAIFGKLIYAHLHRSPHVRFATFSLLVLNLRGVSDVSVHKLDYH